MVDNVEIYRDIDTKLMLQVKDDNKGALAELYIRNISNVTMYFVRFGNTDGSSEDLAHEVFTRIWLKRKTFREDSTFKAFMFSYCKRILKEHQRNQIRDSKLIKMHAISQSQTNPFCPEKAYIYSELLQNIKKCKSKLSEKQRESIDLLLTPDIKTDTAANKANCSNNTYLKRLSDARKQLKILLKIQSPYIL